MATHCNEPPSEPRIPNNSTAAGKSNTELIDERLERCEHCGRIGSKGGIAVHEQNCGARTDGSGLSESDSAGDVDSRVADDADP